MLSKPFTFTAALIGAALSVSSTVASASMSPGAAVPAAPSGATAACAAAGSSAAVAAGAAVAQAQQPGCVLPVAGLPVAAAPPPPMAMAEPASAGLGIGLPAILLGLAALAGAYFLLFDDDEEGEVSVTRG